MGRVRGERAIPKQKWSHLILSMPMVSYVSPSAVYGGVDATYDAVV